MICRLVTMAGDVACSVNAVARRACCGRLRLNGDILCQGFESLSIGLDYSDGYMTGLAGGDVPYGAGFACMYAADDFASSAVPEFAWCFSFHFHYSNAFRSYPVFSILPSCAASVCSYSGKHTMHSFLKHR